VLRRFTFICFILCCASAFALDFPAAPKQHVNDYAGVLKPEEVQEIDAMLSQNEKETSNQIVVAIFPTLDDESLEDWTNRLFIKWGLGQKENNNGVLLAVFIKEHQVRIEVGYGLEPTLTDALSSRIIRNEIAPAFRENRYGDGIRAAVIAIEKAIAGQYKPTEEPRQGEPPPIPIGTILFVLFILYTIYRSRNSSQTYGRRRYGGWWWLPPGGFGGGGGGGWGGGSGGGGWGGGGGGSSGGGGASGSW
jgi:uncharacterized protein